MKLIDLGPGSTPRKLAAIVCLIFCGLAIPITLFRMFMGTTSTAMGILALILLTILCAGMLALLRPSDDAD